MNVYVLDKQFNIIRVIDDYFSIIWTSRYYSQGDFELYVSAYAEMLTDLQRGFYLVRDKDIEPNGVYRNVKQISNIELITDEEDGDRLVVSGYDLKGLLLQRVIASQTTLNGTAVAGIEKLVKDAIISPSVPARKISNFRIGSHSIHNSQTIERQFTGDILGEAITDICINAQYGYDVYLDNGQFVFYIYEGADRSFSQSENPFIVFSDDFDNLLSSDYKVDGSQYSNVAYVAGEGEGSARKIVTVGTVAGLNRFEKWVDSRNTSSNEGSITEAQYTAMLQQEGREVLAESAMIKSFEGEVINTNMRRINEDFFLGDLVQVENAYGISARVRITEVIESEDENGENVVLSFSDMEV